MSSRELLNRLAEAYGYETAYDMIEEVAFDSLVPAICTECYYTTDMEPDQRAGWCEVCEDTTMKSALVLRGII